MGCWAQARVSSQWKGYRQHTVPRRQKQKLKYIWGNAAGLFHLKSTKLHFPLSNQLLQSGQHYLFSMATYALGIRKGSKKEATEKRAPFAVRSIKVICCENVDLCLLNHLNREGIDAVLVWQKQCKFYRIQKWTHHWTLQRGKRSEEWEAAPYKKHPLVTRKH